MSTVMIIGALCRACGVDFIDNAGHRLCDACLCERINGAGELELDDPDDVINLPPAPWVKNKDSIARSYWAEEVRLDSPALSRLERICEAQGYSYQATFAALREGIQ